MIWAIPFFIPIVALTAFVFWGNYYFEGWRPFARYHPTSERRVQFASPKNGCGRFWPFPMTNPCYHLTPGDTRPQCCNCGKYHPDFKEKKDGPRKESTPVQGK